MNELDYCLKWFESEGINAFLYNKYIYVVIGDDDFEFQISDAEISLRAELYKLKMENQNE